MKVKHKISFILVVVLLISLSLFINNVYSKFKLRENFTSLPLNFNPTDTTSAYRWKDAVVTIKGGFIKGKLLQVKNSEDLLLRSLTPNPFRDFPYPTYRSAGS